MGMANTFRQLKIAVAFAALSSLVFTSIGAAQTTTTTPASGPFAVSLQTPASGARIGGNVTFTGSAVDCGKGVAATRVAVYDGVDRNGTYLADAALDTNRSLARYCTNQAGSGQIGFTLIHSTRELRDGAHTLAFVAEFPGGGTSTLTTEIIVDNFAPRYDRYDAFYGPRYGGNYYGGGYGNNSYYGGGYGNNSYYGVGYGNNSYYGGGYGNNNYYGGGYGYNSPYYGTSGYNTGLCYGSYLSSSCGGYGGYASTMCGGASYGGYSPYSGCGSYSPYSITSCTTYNCGGGYYGNTGCLASYGAAYCRNSYYGAYNYPYANYNYGVYVTGPGYNQANCAYYYISATGCGGGYQYGQSYITLNQAGQSVRLATPIILSGFATCTSGGVSAVTLTDRTANANNVIGTTPTSGSYSIAWTPVGGIGAHVIQVTASGGCGTFSQSFSVTVIP